MLANVKQFRLKLYPKDFYKVKAFYEKELGYQIIEGWDHEHKKGVMFDLGGTVLELLWPGSLRSKYRADISLEVEDVWGLYELMKDKPCLIRGLKDNSWGDTSFMIEDPEGFGITYFTITN